MADSKKSILLRILGENAAKPAIDQVADEIEQLKKDASGDIDINISAEHAKRELREVIAEARLLPREVTMVLRAEGDLAAIRGFQREIEALQKRRLELESADPAGDPTAIDKRIGTLAKQMDAARARIDSITDGFTAMAEEEQRASQRAEELQTQLLNLGRVGAQGRLFGGPDAPASSYTNKPGLGGGTGEGNPMAMPGQMSIDSLRSSMDDLGASEDRVAGRTERLMRSFDAFAGRGLSAVGKGLKDMATGLEGSFPGAGILAALPNALGSVFNLLGRVASSGAQAGSSLLALGAAGASLVAIPPILGLIAFGLVTLISSLGMALIAVIAFAATFVVLLLPIVAVLGAVAYHISQVVAGQQQMQQTTANLTQAIDQQKQAAQSLANAQRQAAIQRLAALQAEKDAVFALTDAQNRLTDARLGVQSANLGVTKAKLDLASFKDMLAGIGTTPGALEKRAAGVDVGGNLGQQNAGSSAVSWEQMLLRYKDLVLAVKLAEQGRKEAVDGVAKSQNDLAKAQNISNNFAQHGLTAYAPYASALASIVTSTDALRTASDRLASAQTAYNAALVQSTPAANHLLDVFHKFTGLLGKIFAPAEVGVIHGATAALDIFANHLQPLQGPLKTLGDAIGGAFVKFAHAMTSPQMMASFTALINNAAAMVGPLTGIFTSLLSILFTVVNTVGPQLTAWLKNDVEPWFKRVAAHPKEIRDFIQDCIDKMHFWIGVIGGVANGFITVIGWVKSLGTLLTPIVWAFDKIVTAIQTVQATRASERQMMLNENTTIRRGNAQIAVDEKLLQHTPSGKMHDFLTTQIANLKATVAGATADVLRYATSDSFKMPFAAGGVATSATRGIFGEAGTEAVVPLAGGGAQLVGNAIGRYVANYLTFAGGRAMGGDPGFSRMGSTTHVDVHLQEGNVIPDAQHFLAVLGHQLEALGGGARGL